MRPGTDCSAERPVAAAPSRAAGRAGEQGRRVVLLHGLWMNRLAMAWLARRLREAGFVPATFGYHSLFGGPEGAVPRLQALLRRGPPAHVVAHSLGGLIVLEALLRDPRLPLGRVVCLGVPLCGSGAARRLARWPLASLWMGRSAALLQRGCVAWPRAGRVGMVAGRIPRGLGGLVAGFHEPHDGTVAVAETRHPGLADHVVVEASHSGLLVSSEAARQAIAFLRDGHFGSMPRADLPVRGDDAPVDAPGRAGTGTRIA